MPDKDYQHKRNNKYWMETPKYRMALAYVRQYPRLCRLRDEILNGLHPIPSERFGGHKGTPSDPTAHMAISLAKIDECISVVDKALNMLPDAACRQAVMDNILYGFNRDAAGVRNKMDGSTVQRWRARFLWEIARIARIP